MSKEKNTETVTSDSGDIRIEMNTGQRISLAMFLSQLYQNVNIQKGFLLLNLNNKLLLNADEAKTAKLQDFEDGRIVFDGSVLWTIELKEKEVELIKEAIDTALNDSDKEFPLAIIESVLFIKDKL